MKLITRSFLITGAVLFSLVPFPALAEDDTPENRAKEADYYLTASPPKEMVTNMLAKLTAKLPAEKQKDVAEAFTKHLDLDALTKTMKASMIRHFTADELKALGDFYGSALGKSAQAKLPAYMGDVMPALQAQVMSAQEKVQKELEK